MPSDFPNHRCINVYLSSYASEQKGAGEVPEQAHQSSGACDEAVGGEGEQSSEQREAETLD